MTIQPSDGRGAPVRCRLRALLATTALVAPLSAAANPQGPSVAAGTVTIEQTDARTLDVKQASKKAIIDWRSFSIGKGEHTRFSQPGSDATALNRVTGKDLSDIQGRLSANGRVFLVNPNGVVFGPGSQVDVGSLIATTADIRNQDFMDGRYVFDRPSPVPGAAVENEGTITVAERGLAAFVAPTVRNSGRIQAKLGQVVLGGAPTFALDLHGDGLISFAVPPAADAPAASDPGHALAENSGAILAEGGRVVMTARAAEGVVDSVVNMSGVIEARSAAGANGVIVLDAGDAGTVQLAGKIDAAATTAGSRGGEVALAGRTIALAPAALVDVRGPGGGGRALIGGGVQGVPALPQAKPAIDTEVAAGATILADATDGGAGGTIVAWAQNRLGFHGTASARGGQNGGDGGFIETSGLRLLDVAGARISASATAGQPGTWLLDPFDIEIVAVLDDGVPAVTQVDADDIGAVLDAGTSVTIQTQQLPLADNGTIDTTGPGAEPGQPGDIAVQDPITKTTGGLATLTLTAAGDITINSSIDAQLAGTLDLNLNAGGAVGGAGFVYGGPGNGLRNVNIVADTVSFGGLVGPLGSLTIAANTITLGQVDTAPVNGSTGDQLYNAEVVIMQGFFDEGGASPPVFTTAGGDFTITGTGIINDASLRIDTRENVADPASAAGAVTIGALLGGDIDINEQLFPAIPDILISAGAGSADIGSIGSITDATVAAGSVDITAGAATLGSIITTPATVDELTRTGDQLLRIPIIALDGTVYQTDGGDFQINPDGPLGSVRTLVNDLFIDTTGLGGEAPIGDGDILINATIDAQTVGVPGAVTAANTNLTLDAGDGTITILGAMGSLIAVDPGAALGSTTLTGSTITLGSITSAASTAVAGISFSRTGNQSFIGALSSGSDYRTNGGSFFVQGPWTLRDAALVDTTSLAGSGPFNGNVTLLGTVNGTAAGAQALTLRTRGTALISFTADVGTIAPLGTVTFDVNLPAAPTATNVSVQTGTSFALPVNFATDQTVLFRQNQVDGAGLTLRSPAVQALGVEPVAFGPVSFATAGTFGASARIAGVPSSALQIAGAFGATSVVTPVSPPASFNITLNNLEPPPPPPPPPEPPPETTRVTPDDLPPPSIVLEPFVDEGSVATLRGDAFNAYGPFVVQPLLLDVALDLLTNEGLEANPRLYRLFDTGNEELWSTGTAPPAEER